MTETSIAGILLTGGGSRRMGQPKALVEIRGVAMAARGAGVLAAVCNTAVEVGPGFTALPRTLEDPPGQGPLAAIVAGWKALGTFGPAIVLAVDMPFATVPAIRLLHDHPSDMSVVPITDDQPQPLCARWSHEALVVATRLAEEGHKSMRVLLEAVPYTRLEKATWSQLVGGNTFDDVDTPEDLAHARLSTY